MRRLVALLTALLVVGGLARLQAAPNVLTAYFIDVEGGQSTLIVTSVNFHCDEYPVCTRRSRLAQWSARTFGAYTAMAE